MIQILDLFVPDKQQPGAAANIRQRSVSAVDSWQWLVIIVVAECIRCDLAQFLQQLLRIVDTASRIAKDLN